MRDVIPEPVFDQVQKHLIRIGNHAETGWESGAAEEDTLTGHLGAQLQRDWTRSVGVGEERWRWRIRYTKFRGRGRGAFEKASGADGIVQIEVEQAGAIVTKGLLFQAKKGDARRDARLAEQVRRMEDIAENGSAVFVYRPHGYRAVSGATLLRSLEPQAVMVREEMRQPLGSYLGESYLPCQTGLRGMYFDGVRKLLIVPSADTVRAIPVEVGHRITIDVQQRP